MCICIYGGTMAGNTLFNSVLIDKIKFNIPKDYVNDEIKEHYKDIMLKYFPQNAFKITISRGRLNIEFTPTRYKVNSVEITDTNLIMPYEKELFKLFEELGFYKLDSELLQKFTVVKLHLTKNINTENHPARYIDMLGNRSYKLGLQPLFNSSTSTNRTLTLSTLKKNSEQGDTMENKHIIFYDKVQELKDKAGINEVYLRLTPEDKNQYLKAYQAEANCLLLKRINILRCELQYAHSHKLKTLEDFLLKTNNAKKLHLATLLDLLKEQKLYSALDNFYTQELRKYVFFDDFSKDIKLSGLERQFADLLDGVSTTWLLNHYENSQRKSLQKVIRKIQRVSTSAAYNELYKKKSIFPLET